MNTQTRIEYTIEPDQDPLNPRTEWDNVGHMVCWHSRYNLGDEQPSEDPTEYLDNLAGLDDIKARIDTVIDHFWNRRDWYGLETRLTNYLDKKRETALQDYIVLPLYLYDHSGITMRCSPFSCPWDSGYVGFIYVSMDRARQEWTGTDDEIREKATECLTGEVETYAQYLEGDVWGYTIERVTLDEDGDESDREELESCWGFFGHSYCEDEARLIVNGYEDHKEAA